MNNDWNMDLISYSSYFFIYQTGICFDNGSEVCAGDNKAISHNIPTIS